MRLRGFIWAALLYAASAFGRQDSNPAAAANTVAPQAPNAGSKAEMPITNVRVECVDPSRAFELIDKYGCIAGRVSRVSSQKNGNTHISLIQLHSDEKFRVVIFAEDRDKVGDLSYLHGRVVVFLGDVTSHRGQPELIVKNREQLRVTAGNPPPEFDASRTKGKSTGQALHNSRTRAW
ncbi:MAG TPA: hypothetical protein VM578_09000 [Candidatus Saccharimonadales bacterium]|nr:hypothetical protein [Candidatus Saccharimonadales bacterium]